MRILIAPIVLGLIIGAFVSSVSQLAGETERVSRDRAGAQQAAVTLDVRLVAPTRVRQAATSRTFPATQWQSCVDTSSCLVKVGATKQDGGRAHRESSLLGLDQNVRSRVDLSCESSATDGDARDLACVALKGRPRSAILCESPLCSGARTQRKAGERLVGRH